MSDDALELLLSGIKDKEQRTTIANAYYSFGNGDPDTFPVRFAILLKAHAAALKLVPTRLERVLATEMKPIRDALAAHQTFLENSSLLPSKPNRGGDILEEIRSFRADLQEQLTTHSQLLRAEREAVVSNITTTHSLLKSLAAHRIVVGLLLSYLAGLLTLPFVQSLVSWFLLRHK
jgi:hypothetical protein